MVQRLDMPIEELEHLHEMLTRVIAASQTDATINR
jgi:hypothetical protein